MRNPLPLLIALVVIALVPARVGMALPSPGSVRPAATVVDPEDARFDLRQVNGRPILIVYEDKDSATLNQALKDELAVLAKGDKYKTSVSLVPVANVEGYDYWPIRGFVKSSIRSESKKFGTTIYCDWDGAFRKALGLRANTSSVVLIGKSARVLFAYEGVIPKAQRARLIELLRREVEGELADSSELSENARPLP